LSSFHDIRIILARLDALELLKEDNVSNVSSIIDIPTPNNANWQNYGALICPILHIYIDDSPQNVFLINHSPASEFIRHLKDTFPLSKIVFVIHDQGWCAPLYGNRETLIKVLTDKCARDFEDEAKYIRSYCEEEQRIYALADKVVCLTEATRVLLSDIYKVPHNKTCLIENGISSPFIRPFPRKDVRKELHIPRNEHVVIFAGRPSISKGILALLKAFSIVTTKRSNCKLVLCGTLNGLTAHSELISKVATSIIFTGFLPKHELFRWYCAANVGVVPSYSEQFGYAAYEMALCGLPLVVSNGYGLTDNFHDGENCFVADIGTDVSDVDYFANSLAKTIEIALSAPKATIHRQCDALLNIIADKFSSQKMATSYYQLFYGLTCTKS
jgi:glycosyltransferase involved in cell wall biosynthesis